MYVTTTVQVEKEAILKAAEQLFGNASPLQVTMFDVARLEEITAVARAAVETRLAEPPSEALKASWKRGVAKRDIDLRCPSISLSSDLYQRVLEEAKVRAKREGRRVVTDHGDFDYTGSTP